jgi:hypothetical protein
MRCSRWFAVAALVLGLGCSDDGEALSETDVARLCEAAEQKLDDCFGVEVAFVPCAGDRAREVLDKSCAEIIDDLAQPKADDPEAWFCTTFPEICDDDCVLDPAACS